MTPALPPFRIVVIDSGYDSFCEEETVLGAIGARIEVFPGDRHDRRGKMEFARGAPGMFVRWTEVDDEFLSALPGLRAVVRYGVGYDNVDLAAATRHGVRVSNVQGYASHSVSDHALALILACARGLPLRAGPEDLRARYTAPPSKHVPEL